MPRLQPESPDDSHEAAATAKIPGRATAEGTTRRRTLLGRALGPAAYREAPGGVALSSIGLGTYVGDADDATDARFLEAIAVALRSGINVLDTAINYRHQRSERTVGRALSSAVASGQLRRDEVFVTTKGGFVAFDGAVPDDPSQWFERTLVAPGILRPGELVAGCHAMTPRFLEDQLGRSLSNLGLETVDVYFLHNPETQLPEVGRAEFRSRLRRAFEQLEREVARGRIGSYGLATWNGFRVGPWAEDHLSLSEAVEVAREVAGDRHHFQFLELPLNLAMPEAAATPTQPAHATASALAAEGNGRPLVPLLALAEELGLAVLASASILQGRLARALPEAIASAIPGLGTNAQRALQFARSAPGLTTALVGMSRVEHVRENAALLRVPSLGPEQFREILGKLG